MLEVRVLPPELRHGWQKPVQEHFLPVVKRNDAILGRWRSLVRVQPGRLDVWLAGHTFDISGALAEWQLHLAVDQTSRERLQGFESSTLHPGRVAERLKAADC